MTLFELNHYTLLFIKGPDAFTFLQGQVTCDVNTLLNDQGGYTSLLGAHCNHQGRILFNFQIVAIDHECIILKIPSSVEEIAFSALNKYIVFSKADISTSDEGWSIYGIKANSAEQLCNFFTETPKENNQSVVENGNILIKVDEQHYELWVNTKQHNIFDQHDAVIEAKNIQTIKDSTYWQQYLMQKKIPEITAETSGLFTPHAISFQDIGVNFQKGCYTGQEVVARMHYLGKSKKQLFLFELEIDDNTIGPGQTLFNASKPVGEIVNVCKNTNTFLILASANIDSAEKNQVYIDAEMNNHLKLIPSPT